MAIENIIYAAIGSIITIIITKILEIFQRYREHRYYLREKYFERKLSAAEKAVAMWFNMSTSFTAISALYEKFDAFTENAGGKTFEALNNELFSKLAKFQETADNLTNAVYLYFDIESDTSQAKQPLKNMYEGVGILQGLAISAKHFLELKQNSNDEFTQRYVNGKAEELLKETRKQIGRLSEIFSEAQMDVTLGIKTLRKKMKKYDK